MEELVRARQLAKKEFEKLVDEYDTNETVRKNPLWVDLTDVLLKITEDTMILQSTTQELTPTQKNGINQIIEFLSLETPAEELITMERIEKIENLIKSISQ